ncbi:MAG: hypothetical protein R2695_10415 [Acidimicrobiales bacterium]
MTAEMVTRMKPGSVLVDVAIDQGAAETLAATTHAEPIYVVDGVVHYCVANMPGAVPKTSTYAQQRHAATTLAIADARLGAARRRAPAQRAQRPRRDADRNSTSPRPRVSTTSTLAPRRLPDLPHVSRAGRPIRPLGSASSGWGWFGDQAVMP